MPIPWPHAQPARPGVGGRTESQPLRRHEESMFHPLGHRCAGQWHVLHPLCKLQNGIVNGQSYPHLSPMLEDVQQLVRWSWISSRGMPK